jgi:hypothetical protein
MGGEIMLALRGEIIYDMRWEKLRPEKTKPLGH